MSSPVDATLKESDNKNYSKTRKTVGLVVTDKVVNMEKNIREEKRISIGKEVAGCVQTGVQKNTFQIKL